MNRWNLKVHTFHQDNINPDIKCMWQRKITKRNYGFGKSILQKCLPVCNTLSFLLQFTTFWVSLFPKILTLSNFSVLMLFHYSVVFIAHLLLSSRQDGVQARQVLEGVCLPTVPVLASLEQLHPDFWGSCNNTESHAEAVGHSGPYWATLSCWAQCPSSWWHCFTPCQGQYLKQSCLTPFPFLFRLLTFTHTHTFSVPQTSVFVCRVWFLFPDIKTLPFGISGISKTGILDSSLFPSMWLLSIYINTWMQRDVCREVMLISTH